MKNIIYIIVIYIIFFTVAILAQDDYFYIFKWKPNKIRYI